MRFSLVVISLLLLVLLGCGKADKDDWTYLTGHDFPVYTHHFADYVSTDQDGNILGTVPYGSGGDNKDWLVQEYSENSKFRPDLITGISLQNHDKQASSSFRPVYPKLMRDPYRYFDAHGFIYPGVPEPVVPDSLYFNRTLIFKTPSTDEVPSTPIIEYNGFPGSPIPCKDDLIVYFYMFGFDLSAPNPTDHTQLAVTVPSGQWYALAYYDSLWHPATPYPANAPGDIIWADIPFADTVQVVFSDGHDPLIPIELPWFSFTATLTEDYHVRCSWVTESETNTMGYNVFRNESNDLFSAVIVNDSLITRGQTPPSIQYTYTFDDGSVEQNHTYYYWLQKLSATSDVYFCGPYSVTVPVYPFPDEFTHRIGVYSAFPNPNSGIFTIKHELQDSTLVNILILNKQLEVVHVTSAHQRFGKHLQQIDISDQPNGLYRVYYWFEKDIKYYFAYGDVLKQ